MNDVSAIFPDQGTAQDPSPSNVTFLQRRVQHMASQSTAWWAARRSGFASIGAMAIPGVGPVVAAGSIIFALSAAVVGGADGGGLARALNCLGLAEVEAGRYENLIKEGSILISVHADHPANITVAATILRQAGARCICTTNEVLCQ